MREFINIVTEGFTKETLGEYLHGVFYHGSARSAEREFHGTATAYFTQDADDAAGYARMDAEVEGGTPVLFKVKLHCTNPAILPPMLMQDLEQTREGAAKKAELIADGYDCAVGDNGHDEIAVLGNSKIEVLEIIPLS